jgi:hypothetical protein
MAQLMDWPADIYELACSAIRQNNEADYAGNLGKVRKGVTIDNVIEYRIFEALPREVRLVFNFQHDRNSIAYAVKTVMEHNVPLQVWAPWLLQNVPVLGFGLTPTMDEYGTCTRRYDREGMRPAMLEWSRDRKTKRFEVQLSDLMPWARDDWPTRFGIKRRGRACRAR